LEEILINVKIAILTTEQKDILDKQEFTTRGFFNPVQDVNEDWVISEVEVNECINTDFMWVKDLVLTDWLGPYIPPETE
jgi:hypothetical protein